MQNQGINSVENGSTGKNNRHYNRRRTLGAKCEQNAKRSNGPNNPGEKRPGHAAWSEGPGSSFHQQNCKGRQHSREEVCYSDTKERFVAAMHRVLHAHLTRMQEGEIGRASCRERV